MTSHSDRTSFLACLDTLLDRGTHLAEHIATEGTGNQAGTKFLVQVSSLNASKEDANLAVVIETIRRAISSVSRFCR